VRNWFYDTIVDKDRLALFLCFLAFVITFVVTRVITRLIHAGRGPFHDHVTASGVHVHHAVPGLFLLIGGAFMSVATGGFEPWAEIAAILIGIGTSLVLDEFALILHMSDVYWSDQGRISVEMVSLAIACLGLALIGFTPTSGIGDPRSGLTLGAIGLIVFHVVMILICVAKGRYEFALLASFVPLVGLATALRLARPNSLWAKRFYGEKRTEKAIARGIAYDRRYGEITAAIGGFVASPTSAVAPSSS
jgi:hypothetical protein